MTAPSELQDELGGGFAVRREKGRRSAPPPAAAYAATVLGQVKEKLRKSAAIRDACPAGGNHSWEPAEKPSRERGEWPPGPWLQCRGCRLYMREGGRP